MPQENIVPQDLGCTQEEIGASHDFVDTGRMWYKSGFWHTGGGWFKAILHSDETFESSSFSKTMVAEPYRQEGYGYRDYPDTSDEETDLVDIEAWPEEG